MNKKAMYIIFRIMIHERTMCLPSNYLISRLPFRIFASLTITDIINGFVGEGCIILKKKGETYPLV